MSERALVGFHDGCVSVFPPLRGKLKERRVAIEPTVDRERKKFMRSFGQEIQWQKYAEKWRRAEAREGEGDERRTVTREERE